MGIVGPVHRRTNGRAYNTLPYIVFKFIVPYRTANFQKIKKPWRRELGTAVRGSALRAPGTKRYELELRFIHLKLNNTINHHSGIVLVLLYNTAYL